MYIHLISHQGRQKPGQGTENRPKKLQWKKGHDITYTFQSPSGIHSANGVLHLLSGKVKFLLRHFARKGAARKKYAVRAAGVFHNIYSRKRNLFSGRSEWRQSMFVAVFLLLFFCAVSILIPRHVFALTINYIYIQLQLFLYKIWSDLVGNLLRTEWVSNSSTLSIQGVQFKSRPGSLFASKKSRNSQIKSTIWPKRKPKTTLQKGLPEENTFNQSSGKTKTRTGNRKSSEKTAMEKRPWHHIHFSKLLRNAQRERRPALAQR